MGYIYKITNLQNNKSYIGQTIKPVEKRFAQHKNNYTKQYFSQLALYQAFKKYGIENFSFDTIEEVDNEKLDEREKYWINFYDTYYNGYNSTLGGRLVQLYDWDIDQVIELYLELKSARKVAKVLGCDHSTIDNILNTYKIKRFSVAEQCGKKIYLSKNNEEIEFSSPNAAAEWLINNNLVQSKNIRCVRNYLTNNCLKNKPYYGYNISYESKRQSVPLVTEE